MKFYNALLSSTKIKCYITLKLKTSISIYNTFLKKKNLQNLQITTRTK